MSYTHMDEEYKGHRLKIESDDDAQSPSEWDNEDAFLCGWDRDFWVPPPGEKDNRDVNSWCSGMYNTHWSFPVEAYVHSGVVLALTGEGNFPDRQWDVLPCAGAAVFSRKEWPSKEDAHKAAESLINEWNQYLSGDVWGYVVEHEESGWEDSCWGFYGTEYCEEQARSTIDWHVEKLRKEHQEQVKTWVRNRVPLERRIA